LRQVTTCLYNLYKMVGRHKIAHNNACLVASDFFVL
jgi:hypothetical protein